jgi:hypothetical protein
MDTHIQMARRQHDLKKPKVIIGLAKIIGNISSPNWRPIYLAIEPIVFDCKTGHTSYQSHGWVRNLPELIF